LRRLPGHTGEIRRLETRDDQLELDELEPVGGYALSLIWFDGHNSGIYSYKYLRSLCQCPLCLPDSDTGDGSLPRS